jgi:hypothetical protein
MHTLLALGAYCNCSYGYFIFVKNLFSKESTLNLPDMTSKFRTVAMLVIIALQGIDHT